MEINQFQNKNLYKKLNKNKEKKNKKTLMT